MGTESRSSISRLTVTDSAVGVHYIAEVPMSRVGFCCLPCVGEGAGTSRGHVAQLGSRAGELTQAVQLRSQSCLLRHSVITAAQGWGIMTQGTPAFHIDAGFLEFPRSLSKSLPEFSGQTGRK